MKQKLICLSIALLCGLATTNIVNADGDAALNEAVAKIQAVGKLIADLKVAAVQADAAAEEAASVLAGAVQVATAPTRVATPKCTCPHPASVAYPYCYSPVAHYPATYYRAGCFPRFVRPVGYYPYYPGWGGWGYGCGW